MFGLPDKTVYTDNLHMATGEMGAYICGIKMYASEI